MNTILPKQFILTKNDILDNILKINKELHFPEMDMDAKIKHTAILDAFYTIKDNITDRITTLVDVGCGVGQMCFILRNFFSNIYGIDLCNSFLNFNDTVYKQSGINMRNTCFFKWNEIADNSIDLFIDGCSITHFEGKTDGTYKNVGIKKCFDKMYKLLKPGGYIIIVSDCIDNLYIPTNEIINLNEFIMPQEWIRIAESSKLHLISDYIYDKNISEDAFIIEKYNLKVCRLVFRK